ncbi:MAG: Rpn family recombination-promoting nuclease/putative transposase [Magnetococcales bacterium]|nr:Rpn family recombination-promoting nuclease/putative transposase [Magnetococcales bacterium]
MMQDQDSSYKRIYSHPEMMRDLLLGFVDRPWVKQLDYTTLQKVPTRFVADNQRQKEDDLVWRAGLPGVEWPVYLPFEVQTTSDGMMPVRAVSYAALWLLRSD